MTAFGLSLRRKEVKTSILQRICAVFGGASGDVRTQLGDRYAHLYGLVESAFYESAWRESRLMGIENNIHDTARTLLKALSDFEGSSAAKAR